MRYYTWIMLFFLFTSCAHHKAVKSNERGMDYITREQPRKALQEFNNAISLDLTILSITVQQYSPPTDVPAAWLQSGRFPACALRFFLRRKPLTLYKRLSHDPVPRDAPAYSKQRQASRRLLPFCFFAGENL